jgi:hypothetical protein
MLPPRFRARVVALAMILVPGAARAQAPASPPPSPTPRPCSAPEHRQFDFWLGEWQVTGPSGKVAGTNSIRWTVVFDGTYRRRT